MGTGTSPREPGPDGVDFDANGFRCLGCGSRQNFAGVVHAVGQEDDDPRFGFLIPQSIDAGPEGPNRWPCRPSTMPG